MLSSSVVASSNQVAEDVQAGIVQCDQRLREVSVDVTGPGIIHLSGTVRSFYLRQLAVSLARQMGGVHYVSDGIHVASPDANRRPRQVEGAMQPGDLLILTAEFKPGRPMRTNLKTRPYRLHDSGSVPFSLRFKVKAEDC